MIKKTVCYDSSPALHIAEARVIELSSGTSLAQFLMAYILCFHHAGRYMRWLGEDYVVLLRVLPRITRSYAGSCLTVDAVSIQADGELIKCHGLLLKTLNHIVVEDY